MPSNLNTGYYDNHNHFNPISTFNLPKMQKCKTNHKLYDKLHEDDPILSWVNLTGYICIWLEPEEMFNIIFKIGYIGTQNFERTNLRNYLKASHVKISATKGKVGFLKFSIDINLLYPRALIISVKSIKQK